MKIKNKKNKANYLNFRANGVPKKILIQAGRTADIKGLNNLNQVINSGDFERGFFEIVEEQVVEKPAEKDTKKETSKKATKKKFSKKKSKKKESDSLEKIEKEVKDYTDNEE